MTAASHKPEVTQLYQDTAEELRQFLLCTTGDAQQADQIAQDCYSKLCRLNHYRGVGNQRCYLFNMAVRLAVSALGRRRVDASAPGGHTPRGQSRVGGDALAYKTLVNELQAEAIKDALLDLSDRTRYIFLLHRYRGLSYDSIARHLGLPVSAIDSHMHLALGNIKQAVSEFSTRHPRRRQSYQAYSLAQR